MRSHCRGDAEWQAYRPVDIDARPVKCQLARFKSNISYCLQLCSSDNRSAENTACQYCHPVAIALLCIRCQRRWTLFLRRLMTAGYLTSICVYQFQTAASFATWRKHRHFHSRWLPVGISPLLWGNIAIFTPDGYQLGFLHFYEALVTTALDSDALTASSIRCLRVRSLDCFLYSVSDALSSAGDIWRDLDSECYFELVYTDA